MLAELAGGIRRVTFPLPTPPGHVHAYLLPGEEGWTVVDTGLGLPDAAQRWSEALAGVDGAVARIAITHFHPDHVGAGEDLATLTGAAVHQGELDYAQSEAVWGREDWPERLAGWFRRHGVPGDVADDLLLLGAAAKPLIRFARDPVRLREGDRLDGWEVLELPGHADGHLCLLRDGVLVAGDHLLPGTTPTVGLYPESRPDPLGDYLASLARTIELAPRLALPGHGKPISDPAARAREIVAHHAERIERTAAALGDEPRSAYEVSLDLFGGELPPGERRFAVAETLAHLEHLVPAGAAARTEGDGLVAYTAT